MGVTPLNCPTLVNGNLQKMNATQKRRSFKRRRLEREQQFGHKWSWLAGVALLCGIVASIDAVPMNSDFVRIFPSPLVGVGGLQFWHQRVARDVTAALQSASLQQQKDMTKDMLMQGSSTEVTMDQPQGQCLLDGEYVPETTVFCEKQVGCRAIQKTGHCCPDYKCDCQKDGKTYLNGDKLVDPETPCTVCYCQGGEILCSSVTCFHRDDCTPKYIPGVCCPEYDNCPVASSLNKTMTTTTSTTLKPELPIAVDDKPKITIKEITKPTEIRITDDNKVIPVPQMLKPNPTTTTTTSTTTSSPTTAATTTTTTTAATPMPTTPAMISTTMMPAVTTENTPTDTIKEKLSEDTEQQSTIVDTNHLANGNAGTSQSSKGGINSGDTLKLSASVAYPTVQGGMSSTMVPPMVLENSGEVEDPVPDLSIFSTQGLPEDPSKVNIKREYFITTEVYDGLGSGEYPNSELIYGSQSGSSGTGQQSLGALHQSSAEVDADTAGSDNIYHIILTTDGPRLTTTSENYLALKGSASTEGSPFEDLSPLAVDPAAVDSKPQASPTTEGPELAKHDHVHQHLDEEEPEIPLEINPAYPSLPADDFSIRGDNNYQLSDNEEIGEEPRSIGGGHMGHGHHLMMHHEVHEMAKNSKHLEDATFGSGGGSGSGSGSGMDMIIEDMSVLMPSASSSTEGSGGMDLNSKSLDSKEKSKKTSPELIQLMYSGEDSSEETRISNSTDFQEDAKKSPEDSSMESVEILKTLEAMVSSGEFGSGSGAGEIKSELKQKEREPTTPKPYKGASSLDIDDISDSSGNGPHDDPKEDAESLKLDDTSAETTADAEKSPKGNILSVKVQQDKAFHEELV